MDGFRKFADSEVHYKVRCGNMSIIIYVALADFPHFKAFLEILKEKNDMVD